MPYCYQNRVSTVHFQISDHRVVLVVPQFTQVLKGFNMILIGQNFGQWVSGSGERAYESALLFWKPNLWLFVDLFLKVGKWVLNCAAGDKLVVRWFIDGIVSAHVLQIRCYRGYKIRVSFEITEESTWLFRGSVQKLDTWSLWPQLGHSSRPSKSKSTNQIPK